MPIDPDISDLVARAKAGDETAIQEFLTPVRARGTYCGTRPPAQEPSSPVRFDGFRPGGLAKLLY